MRAFFCLIASILIMVLPAQADEPVRAKVKIPFPQDDLQKLVSEYNLDIERGGPDFIFGYLTEQEISVLRNSRIEFEIIYADYREESNWVLSLFDFGEYHTHDEVVFFLDSVATMRSNICRLDTLGYSTQNRMILGIRISDNPQIEEDEPEVRIMGAHHGDEKISVELPLYLIDYLTTKYGIDEYITGLVNSREIFIIPMVNPDGVTYNTRYNSRGQDINRDYLCPEGNDCPAYADYQRSFSEPETRAIRDDALVNRYVLSLSLHSGATNINTVWNYDDGLHLNGQYHETPDDALIMGLSRGYAQRNTTPGFYVTNGCDWYSTHGDANDYSYGYFSDIDWTIELSEIKTPPQDQIEDYWDDNRDAMIYIMDSADIGIRGVVVDSLTGAPLDAAIVVEEGGVPIFTDPIVGNYHRPLLPGVYHIRAESPGYVSSEIGPIEVTEGPAQIFDFQLAPSTAATINISVADSLTGEPLQATIRILSGNFDTLFFFDGTPRTIALDSDIYDIDVFARGYLPVYDHVFITEYSDRQYLLRKYSVDLFADDFEGGPGNWIFGGSRNYWDTGENGYMSDSCLQDCPGNYYSNTNSYARADSIFDLSGFESAGFYFMEKHYFQPFYDFMFVDVSVDGGSHWTSLADTLTGYSNPRWINHFISLDDYCGAGFENIALRFRVFSGSSVNYDGVYIDDFYFGGFSSSTRVDENIIKPEQITLFQNYPNPFNSSTIIRLAGVDAATSPTIEIYDILGRIVGHLMPEKQDATVYLWRGLDDTGKPLASGIYFYKVANDNKIRSMTLLK